MASNQTCQWEKTFFLSSNAMIAVSMVTILIGLIAMFGNGLALLSFCRKPSLREPQFIFIGSLVAADFSVSLITMPIYVSSALTWPFLLKNDHFEMFLDFLVFQTLSASCFSLCAVTYNRYLTITASLSYASTITPKKQHLAIAIIWLASIAIGSCSFIATGYVLRPLIYSAIVFISFVIPLISIAYYYAKMFHAARQQANKIAEHENAFSLGTYVTKESSNEPSETANHEREPARDIAMGSRMVCWDEERQISDHENASKSVQNETTDHESKRANSSIPKESGPKWYKSARHLSKQVQAVSPSAHDTECEQTGHHCERSSHTIQAAKSIAVKNTPELHEITRQISTPVSPRVNAKLQRKAAKTIAIVIGTFVVCWLPNLIVSIVHLIASMQGNCEAERMEQIWLATIPFALLNSALNPLIYVMRNEEFRKAFKEILKL